MADIICDAQFMLTLRVSYRKRGKTQELDVEKMLDEKVEGHSEICMRGGVVVADQGYGSLQIWKSFMSPEVSGIRIMRSN